MTCKECYHYDACGGFLPSDLDKDVWDLCTKGNSDEIPDIEDRCSEFKDKSLIIELPCKVGDTVYVVQQVGKGHWEEDKYILDDRGTPKVYEKKFNLILLDYIGDWVFLTREAAEIALKAKEGE